jgi:hypothetical protein
VRSSAGPAARAPSSAPRVKPCQARRPSRSRLALCAAGDTRQPPHTRPDLWTALDPPAMEPPAKRMRILQSLGIDEVDESNPEYLKGKQQNSEWLQNRWHAIYAKYEAMPDMMSDEVDMRGEGSIVVDRGHMRTLDKQYRTRLGQRRAVMPAAGKELVDDMFANDKDMGLDEDDDDDDDGRDELAPSQSPEPMPPKSNALPAGSAADQHATPVARSAGQSDRPVPNTPINAALQATFAASANPAADLIQLVQFPQTPAGQQARKAFEVQTAQAVQQAVASIFSSLLSNVPTLQPPQSNLLPAPETPATPAVETREVAPATAPGLYRPPPPVILDPPAASQSSPIPIPQGERRKRPSFAVGVYIKPRRHGSTRENIPLFLEHHVTQTPREFTSALSVTETVSHIDQHILEAQPKGPQGPEKRQAKHVFTPEDDQYIIESRILHKRTWPEIINSRPQWQHWNRNTFWQHWCSKLRKQAAEMERSGEFVSLKMRKDAKAGIKDSLSPNERLEAQPQRSPAAARHLPTPSSLGHDENRQPDNEHDSKDPDDMVALGEHLDDDEKDLLSLYGDRPMYDVQADSLGGITDEDLDDAREIPETPMNLTQESSIQAVLQGTVTREPTTDVATDSSRPQTKLSSKKPTAPTAQQTKVSPENPRPSKVISVASMATITRTSTKNPIAFLTSAKKPSSKSRFKSTLTHHTDIASDLSPEIITSSPPPPTSSLINIHQCSRCKQTFATPALLANHAVQPHPREIRFRASSPLPSSTPAPTTPLPSVPITSSITSVTIKREPEDSGTDTDAPTPTNFFLSTPTYHPFSPSMAKPSSTGKTTSGGKLSRSAYNEVKRSWARAQRGAGSTPGGATRKRQRQTQTHKQGLERGRMEAQVPRKRVWHEDEGGEGSEDELAM